MSTTHLLQVVDSWEALEVNHELKAERHARLSEAECRNETGFDLDDAYDVTFFKLLRLPGQEPLQPRQVRL